VNPDVVEIGIRLVFRRPNPQLRINNFISGFVDLEVSSELDSPAPPHSLL
jgi:hypothetical protein